MASVTGIEKTTPAFRAKAHGIAQRLGTDPENLLAVMSFETGGTFAPDVRNQAGSGATGLLQFLPSTARGLGTSTDALAQMSPEAQLDVVEQYLQPFTGRVGTLQDLYMSVLYPSALGKAPTDQLFAQGSKAYSQNQGLDTAKKGYVTVGDALTSVMRTLGLQPTAAEAADLTAMQRTLQPLSLAPQLREQHEQHDTERMLRELEAVQQPAPTDRPDAGRPRPVPSAPVAPPPAEGTITRVPRNWFLPEGSSLAEAIGGIGMQVLGGARDAFVNTMQGLNAVTGWLHERGIDLGPRVGVNIHLPEIPKTNTTAGDLVRSTTQFVTLFLPMSKALQALGVAGKVGSMTAGAITDLLAYAPDEARLSDVLSQMPAPLRNPLTRWLAHDADDGPGMDRLKRAVEGVLTGGAMEAFLGTARLLKASRRARLAERQAVAQVAAQDGIRLTDDEIAQAIATEQAAATARQATHIQRVEAQLAALRGEEGPAIIEGELQRAGAVVMRDGSVLIGRGRSPRLFGSEEEAVQALLTARLTHLQETTGYTPLSALKRAIEAKQGQHPTTPEPEALARFAQATEDVHFALRQVEEAKEQRITDLATAREQAQSLVRGATEAAQAAQEAPMAAARAAAETQRDTVTQQGREAVAAARAAGAAEIAQARSATRGLPPAPLGTATDVHLTPDATRMALEGLDAPPVAVLRPGDPGAGVPVPRVPGLIPTSIRRVERGAERRAARIPVSKTVSLEPILDDAAQAAARGTAETLGRTPVGAPPTGFQLHINFDVMTEADDVKDTLLTVARLIQGQVQDARRGVVTVAETLAQSQGSPYRRLETLLAMEPGTQLAPADLAAAVITMRSALRQLTSVRQQWLAGDTSVADDLWKLTAIASNITAKTQGAIAEQGRAFQLLGQLLPKLERDFLDDFLTKVTQATSTLDQPPRVASQDLVPVSTAVGTVRSPALHPDIVAAQSRAAAQVAQAKAEAAIALAETKGVTRAELTALAQANQEATALARGVAQERGRAQVGIVAEEAQAALAAQREALRLAQRAQQDAFHAMTHRLATGLEMLTEEQQAHFMIQAQRSTGAERFSQLLYGSLFSNPASWAINAADNALRTLWAVPERFLAAGLGDVSLQEGTHFVYGLTRSLREAWGYASRALATGQSLFGDGKLAMPRELAFSPDRLGITPESILATGAHALNVATATGPRMLLATDEFFKTLLFRAELHAQALRRAAGEARQAGQAVSSARVQALVTNPLDDMVEAASSFANQTLLAQPLTEGTFPALSRLAEKLNQARQDAPFWQLIMPILQTPYNIFREGAARTPLGLLLSPSIAKSLAQSGAEGALARAKMGLGVLAMATVAGLVQEGRVTGKAPPGQKATWDRQGRQENSLLLDGTWYRYDRADTLGLHLGLTADAMTLLAHLPQQTGTETLGALLGLYWDNMLSKTWLRTMSDTVSAVSGTIGETDQQTGREAIRWLHQRVPSLLIPAGVAAVAKDLDPAHHEISSVFDGLLARLPGLSTQLTTPRDLYGRPRMRPEAWPSHLLNPITSMDYTPTAADQEIERLGMVIQPVPRTIHIADPGRQTGWPVELTPAQQDRLIVLSAGEGLSGVERPLLDQLNALVASAAYRHPHLSDGPTGGRAGMIATIIQNYREAAIAQLRAEDPSFNAIIQARELARASQQVTPQPDVVRKALDQLGIGGAR